MKVSFELSPEEFDTLYYACAHSEMMWRQRSRNPAIDNHGAGEDPGDYEALCRSEMKRYREMQKRLAEMHPDEWVLDWGSKEPLDKVLTGTL